MFEFTEANITSIFSYAGDLIGSLMPVLVIIIGIGIGLWVLSYFLPRH